jgi:hypothetical protein
MGSLTFVGDEKAVHVLVFVGGPVEVAPELYDDFRVADLQSGEVGVGMRVHDPLHVLAHLDLVVRPVSRAGA